jgi:ABC-type multidrug transport system fused ATPase/permease subunit
MAYISGLQLALNDALMNLALWFILILAIPLVTSRFIDGVYLGFLALAILASFEAIHPLAQTFQFLGHSIAAGERLFKITDAPSIVANIASSLRHDYDFSRSRSAQGFGRMQVCHSSLRSESNSPGTEILPLRCAQGCGSRTQNDMVHLGCQTSSSRPKERAKLQASERDLSRPYEPISYEPSIPAHATLEFDQVHFAYHPHEREVLQGISFQLHPGERVAIVGPSGSGKSTVARLALRLWDPTQGIIRLNGQPHGRFALDDLRNHMGVVAQDTYLFNDTLRANLLLARPNASDDQLALALEQAQLTEFVHRLPKGLDTWIGEQGLRLSGGERQRLAIARALLKDAPMLILDEVTANLDPVTERALLDALDGLMQTRTTLLITHRLIAMERMNEILVLDQGQIIERGTHEQLLAAGNLYRHLFDTQNSIFTIGAGASVIW